jgi:hypothetical protein
LAGAHARAVLDCARIEPLLVRYATQTRELGVHFFSLLLFFLFFWRARSASVFVTEASFLNKWKKTKK